LSCNYQSDKMKAFLILCVVGAAVAAPGGYTGMGGVYKNMRLSSENMAAAKKASQMAVDIFNDESLNYEQENRNTRNVQVYVPSFYTSQPQPVNEGNHARPVRQSQYYDLPLYYQEYQARQSN